MLQYKLETLEGLEEQFHSLYEEKDGAYFLKVSLLNHLGDGKRKGFRGIKRAFLLNHLGDGKQMRVFRINGLKLLNHLGDGKRSPMLRV